MNYLERIKNTREMRKGIATTRVVRHGIAGLIVWSSVCTGYIFWTSALANSSEPASDSLGSYAYAPAGSGLPASLQLAVTRDRARKAGPEYFIDETGRGRNPRHSLDILFTPEGALIDISAAQGKANERFVLKTRRFGRGAGRPVLPAAPRIDGARVEYDRGPVLREWFVNLPQGIEQGWTVTRRLPGDGPLVLELDTGRAPDRSESANGSRQWIWADLVYQGLVALDSTGKKIPVHWTHDGAHLRIEVDDRGAVYPVVIDPWVQLVKLSASDGMQGNQFGFAVSISGETALIGAATANVDNNINQGAAYIYRRINGRWVEEAKLVASDGQTNDQFGTRVAISGNTALIGALQADIDGALNQGAAYVFVNNRGTWIEQAKLVASDGAAQDFLGVSVDLDGDTAAVGAAGKTIDGNVRQGAAYVFVRDRGVWAEQQRLTASDGAAGDQFSRSAISISGNSIVAGSGVAAVNGVAQGAAYVFTRVGDVWSEEAKLVASDGASADRFGFPVEIENNTALIGATGVDGPDSVNQGAAYVFVRNAGVWTEQAKLTVPGLLEDGLGQVILFGQSLGLAGDTAVIGTGQTGIGTGTGPISPSQGAAYIFKRNGDIWAEETMLVAVDGETNDRFGFDSAISGKTVLIGAPQDDGTGSAYIFIEGDALVEGFVQGLGRCNLEPGPAAGAEIIVESQSDIYIFPPDSTSGAYHFALDAVEGPIDISVSAPGHLEQSITGLELTADETLVQNFDLVLNAPCLDVQPESVSETLSRDESAAQVIVLNNIGVKALDWGISQDVVVEGSVLGPLGNSTVPDTVRSIETVQGLASSNLAVDGDASIQQLESPQADQVTLTHSVSLNIEEGNSVLCSPDNGLTTSANRFLRTFTLTDFGIRSIDVSEVTFGIESLSDDDELTVNLYTLANGNLVFENLNLIGTATQLVSAQSLSLITVPVTGSAPANSTLVVEIEAPDLSGQAAFFPGSNNLGESAPSFLAASACGIDEPVTYADLGFPEVHLVMTVTGAAEPLDCALPGWLSVEPLAGTVGPSGAQEIDVTLDASGLAAGDMKGTLCITSNDPIPLFAVPVDLTVLESLLSATPSAVDFGAVPIGSAAGPATLALSSTGTGTVVVNSISEPTGPFTRTGGSCVDPPFSLASSAGCTLEYAFTPTSEGNASTIISFVSNGTPAQFGVPLTGTGIQAPGITIDPELVDFGDVAVGQVGGPRTVVISSSGTADLEIDSIGDPASPFSRVGGSCVMPPFTLAPGEDCTLEFSVLPASEGVFDATVAISSNAGNSNVSLTSVGVSIPEVLLSTDTLDFGTVAVGTVVLSTITISNSGTGDLQVNLITDPGAPFSLGFDGGITGAGSLCSPAPFSLATDQSCAIEVRFSPKTTGAFNATFSILSNAPTSPNDVELAGAVGALVPVPSLNRFGLLLMAFVLAIFAVAGLKRHSAWGN